MGNYREDKDLIDVLHNGLHADMGTLIDIITDNGKGRISLSNETKEELLAAASSTVINSEVINIDESAKFLIAQEIQGFGGNTIINLFRGGEGVLYKEIAIDVASHLGANYNDKQDISQIEGAILLKVVEKSMEKMSEEEKKQFFDQFGVNYEGAGPVAMAAMIAVIKLSGHAAYKLSLIVANAASRALIGKGLTFAANRGLMQGVSMFTGPIGWAITGIWTAFDLASPAYRVTVPCVIQIAYMRQQALIIECQNCHAPISKDINFCGECGQKLFNKED